MEPESSSFWSDIKKYEDTLAKDPQSYCFAPLSELYRKVGLLDDALNVAKRGCETHPDYVGGFMALGRAYFEKGMKAESRTALESVVRGTPDNLLAQKILSQLYVEAGDQAAAEIALQTILTLNPGDLESQVLLESVKRASSDQGMLSPENSAGEIAAWSADSSSEQESDEEFLLEELDVVEELAGETADGASHGASLSFPEPSVETQASEAFEEFLIFEEAEPATTKMDGPSVAGVEEDQEWALPVAEETPQSTGETVVPEGKDPLTTATLAELYVSQGFLKRALAIYRELLTADPDSETLRQRMVDLQRAIDSDETSVGVHPLEEERAIPESSGMPESISLESDEEQDVVSASTETGDAVISTLESWLENISRRR